MNKTLKISLWALVAITLLSGGYLAWQYLIRGTNGTGGNGQETGTTEETVVLPKVLSEFPAVDYWINKNSGEIYYLTSNGQIYKINTEGKSENTGSKAVGNLSTIKPSTNGAKLLVGFGYPFSPTFAIHDLSAKTWFALPEGTTAVVWDPLSSNRVAYLKDNGSTSQLYLLTLNDQKFQSVTRISQKDLDLDWVLPDTVYLKERPSAETQSSIWSFNVKTKVIKTLARNEAGLVIKWSPDGQRGLKWSDNALTLIDKNNRTLAGIDLKTLPTECVFVGSSAYCSGASSQSLINGEILLGDYIKKAVRFTDDIYFIPFHELAQIPAGRIFDSLLTGVQMDADRLEARENELLFINRHDNRIYSLEL